MPKFFCEYQEGNQLFIEGEDARHIKQVLRMKPGEQIIVAMKGGYDCYCEIDKFAENNVILNIIEKDVNNTEPSTNITLYQALPKGDKLDFIIQKSVELGVSKIIPVSTKRCVSRPDEKSIRKKTDRWNKIAKEAAKQSGRGMVPEVCTVIDYQQSVLQLSKHEVSILCYENGGTRLTDIVRENTIDVGLMIGPEGGFEEQEVLLAKKQHIEIATLGRLILRCETAPIAALAIIMNHTKNI